MYAWLDVFRLWNVWSGDTFSCFIHFFPWNSEKCVNEILLYDHSKSQVLASISKIAASNCNPTGHKREDEWQYGICNHRFAAVVVAVVVMKFDKQTWQCCQHNSVSIIIKNLPTMTWPNWTRRTHIWSTQTRKNTRLYCKRRVERQNSSRLLWLAEKLASVHWNNKGAVQLTPALGRRLFRRFCSLEVKLESHQVCMNIYGKTTC